MPALIPAAAAALAAAVAIGAPEEAQALTTSEDGLVQKLTDPDATLIDKAEAALDFGGCRGDQLTRLQEKLQERGNLEAAIQAYTVNYEDGLPNIPSEWGETLRDRMVGATLDGQDMQRSIQMGYCALAQDLTRLSVIQEEAANEGKASEATLGATIPGMIHPVFAELGARYGEEAYSLALATDVSEEISTRVTIPLVTGMAAAAQNERLQIANQQRTAARGGTQAEVLQLLSPLVPAPARD